ncbi:MAG: hypothetical protein ACT4PT_07095 [Methanobacteriota archaeon]
MLGLAYIDPGTGSLAWQVLLSGFFAVAFLFRRYVQRAKVWLAGIFRARGA